MIYRDPEQTPRGKSSEKYDGALQQSIFDAVDRAEQAGQRPAGETRSLNRIAWDELNSKTCACGARKQIKRSFCRDCYYSLSRKMQSALYTPMLNGYAEIYFRCKDILKRNGRIEA